MLITPDTVGKLRVVVSEKAFTQKFKESVKNDVYFKDHFTEAGLKEVFKLFMRTAPLIDWDNLGDICNHIQEVSIEDYIEAYGIEILDIVDQDNFIAMTKETVLYFAGFGG